MQSRNSILKTLFYADIFRYPLKKEEIWKFLISQNKINKEEFNKTLSDTKNISSLKDFYFLKGKRFLVKERLQREKESKKKIRYANKVLAFLFYFPTIKMIGISGSLAMLNSEKWEDIDIFIISRRKNIWTTRFFLIFCLLILGKYRRRGSKDLRNLFCINMLLDERNLSFPNSERNLYLAHEIVQVMPLYQRENSYEKFMSHNIWIKEYFLNYRPFKISQGTNFLSFLLPLFDFLRIESLFKKIQLFLMHKKLGQEKINDQVLAFHPSKRSEEILKEFNKKLLKESITRGH